MRIEEIYYEKQSKIILICLSSIFIVVSIALWIINYIILPPKVSENAIKYKYNHNNMLMLKSITVDSDKVIYEFSSLNKYFSKNYAFKNKSNNIIIKGKEIISKKINPCKEFTEISVIILVSIVFEIDFTV